RRPVHGDRAREDEALDRLGPDGGVDDVDRAEDVVRVVEAPDEMGEPLRRVRGEVEDVGEAVLPEQLVDELGIRGRAEDERRAGRHVLLVAAAEVVEHDDVVTGLDEVPRDVGADEAGASGYENLHSRPHASNSGVSTMSAPGSRGSSFNQGGVS